MTLVGILSEPQGPAYLPPTATGARPTPAAGHPDEWAGVSSTSVSISSLSPEFFSRTKLILFNLSHRYSYFRIFVFLRS